MLEIENLEVSYGSIKALHGISLKVPEKSIVTLIGANGAGKSTTLRAISGLVKSCGGTVRYAGEDITNLPAHAIVARGLCHVPEGRMVFANLTVEENLRMGAYLRNDKAGIAEDIEYAFTVFPRLKERISQQAGTLSGGEQQMLAIARALLTNPRLLILDEATEGLAPLIRDEIWRTVGVIRAAGIATLIVDKNVAALTALADRVVILVKGEVAFTGTPGELTATPERMQHLLGV